jgi:cyclohexa-1,5-dienecarbonyl-CoA hydratase
MIEVEKHERVVTLALDSPPVNVLDSALLSELEAELARCAAADDLAAVLLRGTGRCFSAGASVEEHTQDKAPAMLSALLDACTAMADLPVPVVGLVHGSCLGGALELISFCDFVVADPSALFGVPEITLAFFPPIASVRLPRLAGLQNTAFLALSGESVGADRAAAMGLVQKILPLEQWEEIFSRFNGLSAPVLRLAKEALRKGAGGYDLAALEGMNALFLDRLYSIEDVAEGIASFEQRRRPSWSHR